tara:strand:- start:4086 stop:4850 length:765 start_codon:yes stop_codon:yes gene_type:complete
MNLNSRNTKVLDYLKNHPFPVEAHFDRSLVLTFAIPKSQIESLIPTRLTLDTFQSNWAFIAVAMVQTRALRPKGFPNFLGNDFILIGYRVFTRYQSVANKKLRGLYILKSETDKKTMKFLGNIFTHYNYSTTDIHISRQSHFETIESSRSKFSVKVEYADGGVALPRFSPFESWKEARRFAGPLPFTFTFDETNKTVLIIEGVRSNWNPKPIQVIDYRFDFFNQLDLQTPILASAFEVRDIPYYWKKGKLEKWK